MNVLKAMGIQQWRRRSARPVAVPAIEEDIAHIESSANDNVIPEMEAGFDYSGYETNMAEPVAIPSTSDQTASQSFAGSLKGALNTSASSNDSEAKGKTDENVKQDEKSMPRGGSKKVVPLDISDLLGAESEQELQPLQEPQPTNNEALEFMPDSPVPESGQLGDEFYQGQELPSLDDYHLSSEVSVDGLDSGLDGSSKEPAPTIRHDISTLNWGELESMLETNVHCPSCGWGNGLLGSGAQQASWMFVIDAPNSREIEAKSHFIGRSGQLFEAVLSALGLERSAVYCTSIFKCAPTDDLSVTPQCDGLLQRQIDLVEPKVIITFGEFAAQSLLKSNANIENLRLSDQQHLRTQTMIVPTFGPSEMLDDTLLKSKVWSDLKKALSYLAN